MYRFKKHLRELRPFLLEMVSIEFTLPRWPSAFHMYPYCCKKEILKTKQNNPPQNIHPQKQNNAPNVRRSFHGNL